MYIPGVGGAAAQAAMSTTNSQQAGFDLGGILSNTLNQATGLLGTWGALEIQSEMAKEIAEIGAIQQNVANGQQQEQNVPTDSQNANANSGGLPDWAPMAMFGIGGLAAVAIIIRMFK